MITTSTLNGNHIHVRMLVRSPHSCPHIQPYTVGRTNTSSAWNQTPAVSAYKKRSVTGSW